MVASHLPHGSVGQRGGRRWAQKPSGGFSCFNSLDLQSRESIGRPERTSGQNDWQGLKASSETDLVEEGDLERNGVLQSTEKHPEGGTHGTGAVNSIPHGCLPSVLAVWFWGQAGLEGSDPRSWPRPLSAGLGARPRDDVLTAASLVDRPLCCLSPRAGSQTHIGAPSLTCSPAARRRWLLEWGSVRHQCPPPT